MYIVLYVDRNYIMCYRQFREATSALTRFPVHVAKNFVKVTNYHSCEFIGNDRSGAQFFAKKQKIHIYGY